MHIFPNIPEEEFEGYIFDCDGTLANSMPIHFEAGYYALSKNGAKFEFTWDLFYSMAGMSVQQSVKCFNEKFNHSLEAAGMSIDVKEFLHGNLHRIVPIVEVVEMARTLSKVKPISVASGGPRVIVHRILEIIKANDIFPHVVTQDDVVNCKPHPEIFLHAASKMGVRPEKCLVFEDSLLGIEAAKSAGMMHVYVEPGKHQNIASTSN